MFMLSNWISYFNIFLKLKFNMRQITAKDLLIDKEQYIGKEISIHPNKLDFKEIKNIEEDAINPYTFDSSIIVEFEEGKVLLSLYDVVRVKD